MKKLLSILLAIGLLGSSVQAVDSTFNIINGATVTTNLFHGTSKITGIYIYNGSSVNSVYALYDAPNTNTLNSLTYSNLGLSFLVGETTSYITYKTNWNQPATNFYGFVYTNVFTNVIMTVPVTVAANYKGFRLLATGTVASSNTVEIALPDGINVVYGLTLTNTWSTNASVRLIYSPL